MRAAGLPPALRILFVAVTAFVLWQAGATNAAADMLVASDSVAGNSIGGTMTGSPSNSQLPNDSDLPLVRENGQSPILGGPAGSGGAGSPAPTFGPSTGLVAFVSDSPSTAPNTLISRLSLHSRHALPSPLEDRFFRPPRAVLAR